MEISNKIDNKDAEQVNTTRKRIIRRLFAIASEIFGRDAAEYLIRAYSIVNYGKDSIRSLTEDEIKNVVLWLNNFE